MPITRPITYAGAAPGANSNTYTLFNSVTTPALKNRIQKLGYSYYKLAMKNSHFGILNGYGSPDSGATWYQLMSRRVQTTPSLVLSNHVVSIEAYPDVKFEWVNGGTAQSPWYITQILSDAEPEGDPAYGNTTYVSGQSMAHTVDFRGPSIQVGAKGELEMAIQWAATGTPVGTFSLVFLKDGTNWRTVPNTSSAFTQPSGSAGDITCGWKDLKVFGIVALRYVSTSGGAANSSLAAQFATR